MHSLHSPLKSVSDASITRIQTFLQRKTHHCLKGKGKLILILSFNCFRKSSVSSIVLNLLYIYYLFLFLKTIIGFIYKDFIVKSRSNNYVGLWEDQGEHGEHSSRAESLHGKE